MYRLASYILAGAVRRWPVPQRAELTREWQAELHELSREPGVPAALRTWRQLRFATSLALARPPGADPVLPQVLRRPAPGQVVWLLLAPLLAMAAAIATVIPMVLMVSRIYDSPTMESFFSVETYVAEAALAVLIGTLMARGLLRRRSGQPASAKVSFWAMLPLIGGLLAVDAIARATGEADVGSWYALIAALFLLLLLPPAAAAATALCRRHQLVKAVLFAVLVAPAVTVAGTVTLVLLAPAGSTGGPSWLAALFDGPTFSISYTQVDNGLGGALHLLPRLMLITMSLGLAYAIRIGRPLPGAAKPTAAHRELPAVVRSPWWYRGGLAGAAYSIVAWAVTLAYLTPNIGVQSSWDEELSSGGTTQPAGWPEWTTEEGRLWMQELQLSCLVCAALFLLLAAAYRGRPVLPVLAGTAVLVGVDMTAVREGWTRPQYLPWLAAGGLLLGTAVWWASIWLGTRLWGDGRPRRLLITVTVLAAYFIPGNFFPRWYVVEGVPAPPVLLLVVVGLPTLLTVLAAMGVRATSIRPQHEPAWRLPAVLASVVAVGGVVYFQDGLIGDSTEVPLFLFLLPLALAVPVAASAIVAIRGRPRQRAVYLGLLPLALAAGMAASYASVVITFILQDLVLFPMDYGKTGDGIGFVPGAVLLGLVLGYTAAGRLDRATPPAAATFAPPPVPVPPDSAAARPLSPNRIA